MWFEIVLIIVCIVLAFFLEREHKARLRSDHTKDFLNGEMERLIENFAKHGSPMRRWDRPTKHNKADEFYWLVRIAREDYLFTDEALKVAVKRADNMRERGLLTDD